MNWQVLWRGMCMGCADVIPGVSGGTMALILGIYTRFISAVKSLNARPAVALLRWLLSGFRAEKWQAFRESLRTIDLPFLLPLACGIFSAMAAGSIVIPTLMDRYPETMRGLFFGLIFASVGVPWKLMPKKKPSARIQALAAAIIFAVFGYLATDPNRDIDTTGTWVEIRAGADNERPLKALIRRGPSSLNAAEVYWANENAGLRASHLAENPEEAGRLAALHEQVTRIRKSDKRARKSAAEHYEGIVIRNAVIKVPRPSWWFVFLAGFIAISAMVLPGISGSFLLLILGCYYFVLNAVKGTIGALAAFEFPAGPLTAVALFALGCMVGLVGFSRVLSWLLRDYPAVTFGALIGLMVGCLRGVWPWRHIDTAGNLFNAIPETLGDGRWAALAAMIGGGAAALLLELIGSRARSTSAGAPPAR